MAKDPNRDEEGRVIDPSVARRIQERRRAAREAATAEKRRRAEETLRSAEAKARIAQRKEAAVALLKRGRELGLRALPLAWLLLGSALRWLRPEDRVRPPDPDPEREKEIQEWEEIIWEGEAGLFAEELYARRDASGRLNRNDLEAVMTMFMPPLMVRARRGRRADSSLAACVQVFDAFLTDHGVAAGKEQRILAYDMAHHALGRMAPKRRRGAAADRYVRASLRTSAHRSTQRRRYQYALHHLYVRARLV